MSVLFMAPVYELKCLNYTNQANHTNHKQYAQLDNKLAVPKPCMHPFP